MIINTSVLRCDALILTNGTVKLVDLPDLHFTDLTDRAEAFRTAILRRDDEKVQETLTWLAKAVTQPVLAATGLRPHPAQPAGRRSSAGLGSRAFGGFPPAR